jgi:hypothetical protein
VSAERMMGCPSPVRLPDRCRILVSGHRVQGRRSRSRQRRPVRSPLTRWPRAGQSIAKEDGTVQHPLASRVSLADHRRPSVGPARAGRAFRGRGRALAPAPAARSAPP